MKLISIGFNNFKYVPENKRLKLDFNESNLIIMGGPNGYGKTTIFDAIELLITGDIKHFNEDLLNRGKESISVLAHNSNCDIVVAGEFFQNEHSFSVQRVFKSEDNFKSVIFINDEETTESELYAFLGINKNLFDLGMYVSQIDSMNFLQQKYKMRKESITGILDNQDIENRLAKFKEIKKTLESQYKTHEEKVLSEIKSSKEKEESIRKQIEKIQLSNTSLSFVKLFPSKEYAFDKEYFDKDDTFDAITSPLNDLIDYTKQYPDFLVKQNNLEIEKQINIDKKVYLAEYYSDDIRVCNESIDLIKKLKVLQTVKQNFDQKKFIFTDDVAKTIALDDEISSRVKQLLLTKSNIEDNMTNTQGLITDILNKRNDLINAFKSSVEQNAIASDNCPLCGRPSDELMALIIKSEESLKSNLGLVADRLKEVLNELESIFINNVINKIDGLIKENKSLIQKYTLLSSYLNIDSKELKLYLQKENLAFSNESDGIEFSVFEKEYIALIERIKSKIIPEKIVIPNETYIKYQQISKEYFNYNQPYSTQSLTAKKLYIASVFSSKMNDELKTIIGSREKLENTLKKQQNIFEEKTVVFTKLISKYNDAYKEYQSSIAQNIAIPMYIFSGKIIQNYPLGLGITIDVQNNAVVFKADGKDSDVFNILSTGQLNGIIISLLLAINEVFSSEDGAKILLIDDPLQSIDDISAISFIDLLSSHFGDTQILLSTHEDDKLKLISRKYEQNNGQAKIFNMQDVYLTI